MRKGLLLSAILLFFAIMFLALTMSTPILFIIDLIGMPILYFKLRKKELNFNFKLINIGLFVFLIISLSIFGQNAESPKKEIATDTTTIESTETKEETKTEEPKVEETKTSTPATTSEENKETSNVKPETTVSTNSSSNSGSSSNSSVKSTNGVTTNEPAPQGRTVYWTPKGKSYHYTKSCPTLARSKTINEGNSSACPKTDPCDKCVK